MHKSKTQETIDAPSSPTADPTTMSEYIARDLRSRLPALHEGGDPLTLQGLSEHYGVSLTPVRRAVEALVDGKFLRKGRNGRVEVDVAGLTVPVGSPVLTEPSRPPASRDLDDRLASEIIGLGLRGRAVHLREEETAARFGVGRTVLRQALNRLAGIGLIEHLPRRGWKVRACDEADLASYLDVREALELKALDLARPHLVDADLKRMLQGNRTAPDLSRLDNEIHGYLVAKSGNRHIAAFFERQGAYYTALFDYAAPEARVVSEMARQHRAILRALLARDWPRARLELSAHIRAQLPVVRDLMRNLAREGLP